MHGILLIFFIIALISGLPINEIENPRAKSVATRNEGLENILRNLLESLRQDMVTGSGSIPVLDPYQLQHLDLQGEEFDFPGSYVALNDVEVRHLSTFVIDKLSISRPSLWQLTRYRLELDVHIPVIEIPRGTYDTFVGVAGYTVFGKGDVVCHVENVEVRINLILRTIIRLTGIFLNIDESNINFNITAFKPALTGIFHDTYTSLFVNAFLSNLVPSLVSAYEEDISRVLSDLVLEVGNEILSDINIIGIIGGL